MRGRSSNKSRNYIASVRHPEGGTYEYVYVSTARKRQEAEDAAREAVGQWGGTLVGLRPAHETRARRLLVVAASTAVLGGTTIATAMFIGLTLEGAL